MLYAAGNTFYAVDATDPNNMSVVGSVGFGTEADGLDVQGS